MSSEPKRILIIKLWAIGDIVMATPVVESLRVRFPQSRITWLADDRYSDILTGMPGLDEVISFDASRWQKLFRRGNWLAFAAATRSLRRRLATGRFDIVLNYSADKWWAPAFNVAHRSVGLTYVRRPFLKGFYTDWVEETVPIHATRYSMKICGPLGCREDIVRMRVGRLPDERDFISSFCASRALDRSLPIVALSPYSSNAAKDWPEPQFANLALALSSKYGSQTVITHSPQDEERAKRLAGQCGALVSGAISLRQFAALLGTADLVVSNDTSGMHIASAVNTPLVALFGPTNAWQYAPLQGDVRILSASDEEGADRGIENICFERVLAAAQELLEVSLPHPSPSA